MYAHERERERDKDKASIWDKHKTLYKKQTLQNSAKKPNRAEKNCSSAENKD